MKVGPLDNNNS